MKRSHAILLLFVGAILQACVVDEEDAQSEQMSVGALSAAGNDPLYKQTLWPNGVVSYVFDDGTLGPKEISSKDKNYIQARMADWVEATSAWQGKSKTKLLQFVECDPATDCPTDFLTLRYNMPNESSSMACTIGRKTNAVLRMRENMDNISTPLHELGHCLGLHHHHLRTDRDRWLVEGRPFGGGTTSTKYFPVVGNYDYDSIMHYTSGPAENFHWKDALANRFNRFLKPRISPHDASLVVQMYARQAEPHWGFFQSLSTIPSNSDQRPNPYLANGVAAVGTPAIARLGSVTHLFALGSNGGVYWKNGIAANWQSLGCCAGSEISAVATDTDTITIAFVGQGSGKVITSQLRDNRWGGWFYASGGFPEGGIKQSPIAGVTWVGPGIASRAPGTAEILAVRTDGRLAVTNLNSPGWTTLGSGYTVNSRPAVLATDTETLQIAYSTGIKVFEPTLSFASGVPVLTRSGFTGYVRVNSAPALAKRTHTTAPYRLLVINYAGRVAHRYFGQWRDIGGIPAPGSGISAVQTDRFSADMIINGTPQMGCTFTCNEDAPNPNTVVQPGGLWVRRFQ